MLAGQLEQVSVVARLLASQRLLVSPLILADVALILAKFVPPAASNVRAPDEFFDVEKREKVPRTLFPNCF